MTDAEDIDRDVRLSRAPRHHPLDPDWTVEAGHVHNRRLTKAERSRVRAVVLAGLGTPPLNVLRHQSSMALWGDDLETFTDSIAADLLVQQHPGNGDTVLTWDGYLRRDAATVVVCTLWPQIYSAFLRGTP